LYYYRARYYSPRIGRFLQTDPIGTKDDLDLYTYVGNDPLDKTDPTGTAGDCPPKDYPTQCENSGSGNTKWDFATRQGKYAAAREKLNTASSVVDAAASGVARVKTVPAQTAKAIGVIGEAAGWLAHGFAALRAVFELGDEKTEEAAVTTTAEAINTGVSAAVTGVLRTAPSPMAKIFAAPLGKGTRVLLGVTGADRAFAKGVVIQANKANDYVNEQVRQLNVGIFEGMICQADSCGDR